MLTVDQMQAAIFARSCDLDSDFESGIAAARAAAEMPYDHNNRPDRHRYQQEMVQMEELYRAGRKVLAQFTMRFDHRSTCHTYSNGRIPGQDDGVATLRCEAGHIGTMQAYDTAIFNPRVQFEEETK